VGGVAVLWSLSQATDNPDNPAALAALAAVTGAAAAGPGMAGADIDLDRAAAIAWPPRRALHVLTAAVVVVGIIAATALTGDQLAPVRQIVRDAVGLSGLTALGAATLGASRAWIPPLAWTILTLLWAPPGTALHQQVLAWMLQPAHTTPATVTALVLGAGGVLSYALLGPRP
jgi:hypothetical protein